MDAFLIAVGSLVLYLVAYRTYGRWLSRKLFKLDPDAIVPSKQLADGHDYVATKKGIIFGHHFTSIAGTGPIVGPALAVIWGWVPALIWVLFGSIFIGAVHDLGSLVVSMRNRGQTIGEVAGRLINPRVKVLFLVVLFLALTIVLAIFGLVIAAIFKMYPASVLSVWVEVPIAILVGWWVYKRGKSPHWPAAIAVFLMMGAIVLAVYVPALQFEFAPLNIAGLAIPPVVIWTLILFVYCYVASTMPVWKLLQPRDYINSHQLVLCLALVVLGIGAATFFHEGGAPIVAPAVQMHPAGAPPIMPFLFITIACGAISGFHCLVASGTTSKQIACETDAQFVGYGAMLTEGFLAVLVILACCAGLGLGWSQIQSGGRYVQGFPSFSVTSFGFLEDGHGEKVELVLTSEYRAPASISDPDVELTPEISRTVTLEVDPSYSLFSKRDKSPLPSAMLGESIQLAMGSARPAGWELVEVNGQLAWNTRYSSWSTTSGLGAKVGAFVDGAGNFVSSLGIPRPVAVAIMAVLVASFAATTLDTATRLQRYVVQELATTYNFAPLKGKHGATAFALGLAAIVAALPPPGQTWATGMGQGGLTLWPLFGATNQLLAGLAFMVIAFYLARRRLPTWFIILPAILMLAVPLWAMLYQLGVGNDGGWVQKGDWHLVVFGIVIIALQVWMIAEGLKLYPRVRGILEVEHPPLPRGFEVVVDD
ncbi:MAG: carbon starvation protein A [Phycisphaerales bacterium]|nr:carbon starvation protein A [Phycisphaerales bacterium]MCB9863661.1 carbon starvation protein A [Phycisphaerales bacterium]